MPSISFRATVGKYNRAPHLGWNACQTNGWSVIKTFLFSTYEHAFPLVYSYGISILDWSWHPVFLIKLRSLVNGSVSLRLIIRTRKTWLASRAPVGGRFISRARKKRTIKYRVFNKVVRGLPSADAADEWVPLDTRVSVFEHLAGCRGLGNVTLFDPVLKRSFIFRHCSRSTMLPLWFGISTIYIFCIFDTGLYFDICVIRYCQEGTYI